MTYFGIDDLVGLPGATFYGADPLGVYAENVPPTSYLHPHVSLPADTGKRVRGPITHPPSGQLLMDDLGNYTYIGDPSFALFLLVVDDVPDAQDVGYGVGLRRLNLGLSEAQLTGNAELEPVVAAGSMSDVSTLTGNAELEPVVAAGYFSGDDSVPNKFFSPKRYRVFKSPRR